VRHSVIWFNSVSDEPHLRATSHVQPPSWPRSLARPLWGDLPLPWAQSDLAGILTSPTDRRQQRPVAPCCPLCKTGHGCQGFVMPVLFKKPNVDFEIGVCHLEFPVNRLWRGRKENLMIHTGVACPCVCWNVAGNFNFIVNVWWLCLNSRKYSVFIDVTLQQGHCSSHCSTSQLDSTNSDRCGTCFGSCSSLLVLLNSLDQRPAEADLLCSDGIVNLHACQQVPRCCCLLQDGCGSGAGGGSGSGGGGGGDEHSTSLQMVPI